MLLRLEKAPEIPTTGLVFVHLYEIPVVCVCLSLSPSLSVCVCVCVRVYIYVYVCMCVCVRVRVWVGGGGVYTGLQHETAQGHNRIYHISTIEC